MVVEEIRSQDEVGGALIEDLREVGGFDPVGERDQDLHNTDWIRELIVHQVEGRTLSLRNVDQLQACMECRGFADDVVTRSGVSECAHVPRVTDL